MKITTETVDKIAHLSRLEIKPEDKEKMVADLTSIVSWMDKLNEVDTSNVEPLIHMTDAVNAFREDLAQSTNTREEALSNAPAKTTEYIKVPKVIE
jgi:aspartyl-tRNA(Asn)/glutamyl-tRNA(Gln) amidotransferase subunit C